MRNYGRLLAEYLQIDSDQVDNEDMVDTDASGGKTRGVMVSWSNCLGGKLRLLQITFVFPSMPLPKLIRMWYCGDVPNNIPPCKILRSCDIAHLKHGKSNLSNMKKI